MENIYLDSPWGEISFKYQHAWSKISGCKVKEWPRSTAFSRRIAPKTRRRKLLTQSITCSGNVSDNIPTSTKSLKIIKFNTFLIRIMMGQDLFLCQAFTRPSEQWTRCWFGACDPEDPVVQTPCQVGKINQTCTSWPFGAIWVEKG